MESPGRTNLLWASLLGLESLMAQALLRPLVPAGTLGPESLGLLGTTASGLCFLAALAFHQQGRKPVPSARRMSLALLAQVPILAGFFLFHAGGNQAETARHARVFLALPPLMALALLPWRSAQKA